MKKRKGAPHVIVCLLVLLLAAPQGLLAQPAAPQPAGGAQQPAAGQKTFSQGELEALLAPVALYPDDLLAQVLMASTYPLEVVQAARWAKANQNLKGDQLTAALEKQTWDPSVKSLVNFPTVLDMMNEKLDWTQTLGDAVLAQQKDVMNTVQVLRKKAYDAGNLKSSKELTVKVDTAYQVAQPSGEGAPTPGAPPPQQAQQVIVIQSPTPQTVYVPAYNPTVVYGAWAYPAYPPYPVYPAYYAPGAALFSFGVGVAMGAAWGYAWGGANWGHGDIDVDVNRNTNINNNIDRSKYQNNVTRGEGGQGKGQWQHNPESRKGVAYRDQNTAQKYNRGQSPSAGTRDAYRGRQDGGGRADAGRGGPQAGTMDRGAGDRGGPQAGTMDRGAGDRGGPQAGTMDRGAGDRGGARQASAQPRDTSAFGGGDRGGQTREASSRGNESLGSRGGGGDRGSGGFSGGGGGGRGGGGGGGGGRGGGGGGRR